jgi:hypothetical protein
MFVLTAAVEVERRRKNVKWKFEGRARPSVPILVSHQSYSTPLFALLPALLELL